MLTEGIHPSVPEAEYHSDPCPAPSLSSGIARLLLKRSPMHAAFAHPSLNDAHEERDPSAAMDAGTILHKLLLGVGMDIQPIDVRYGPKHERAGELVDDWKTKAAQEARDAIREAGKVPVLPGALDGLHKVAVAVRSQLEAHPEGRLLFEPGIPEATLVWRERDIWLRARADFLLHDPKLPILDLKTTGISAAPGEWERRLINEYAIQCAFYRRGLSALRGPTPAMRFIVVEQEPPHGVSVMCAAPSLAAWAEGEVERAIGLCRQCMRAGSWPGYPPFTAHIEAPNWLLMKQEEQMARDEFMEAAE